MAAGPCHRKVIKIRNFLKRNACILIIVTLSLLLIYELFLNYSYSSHIYEVDKVQYHNAIMELDNLIIQYRVLKKEGLNREKLVDLLQNTQFQLIEITNTLYPINKDMRTKRQLFDEIIAQIGQMKLTIFKNNVPSYIDRYFDILDKIYLKMGTLTPEERKKRSEIYLDDKKAEEVRSLINSLKSLIK